MLPQKFSAATTRTPSDPDVEAPTPLAQPASASPAISAPMSPNPPLRGSDAQLKPNDATPGSYTEMGLSPIPVLVAVALVLIGMSTGKSPDWSEHVHLVLAQAGLKRGGARERIIELLAGQPCALSAVQIEDALRNQERPTGRASIYRVLELLVEHGLVERVEVGDGQARFERVRPDGDHHHHLM